MAAGIAVVVIATYLLRDHVRKVKQADMKIAVSALLLSFATFWFGEAVVPLDDLLLVPLFLLYAVAVYKFREPSLPPRPSPSLRPRWPAEGSGRVPRSQEAARTSAEELAYLGAGGGRDSAGLGASGLAPDVRRRYGIGGR